MKGYAVIIVVAVIILFVDEVSSTLRCRLCHGARYLDDCPSFVTCSTDESCFMEMKITEALDIEYWGGCRSKHTCRSATFKKDTLIACSKCCSRDDCNTPLCGLSSINNNTVHCFSCPNGVSDPRFCDTVASCSDNEMCFSGMRTDGTTLQHVSHCYRKENCQKLTMAVMVAMKQREGLASTLKRETDLCDICCGGDLCNSKPCMTLRDLQYRLYVLGRLNNDTLTMQIPHHP